MNNSAEAALNSTYEVGNATGTSNMQMHTDSLGPIPGLRESSSSTNFRVAHCSGFADDNALLLHGECALACDQLPRFG